jgi:hypothetical protein
MRTIVLAFSLLAVVASAQAAPRSNARDGDATMEKKCKEQMGKEQPESEGRSHIGQFQAQRFSDCMMGGDCARRVELAGGPGHRRFQTWMWMLAS